MAWPLSQDYNEAIQDPQSSFSDPELRAGEAICNALGMPMPRSGNFADVYEFNTPATNGKWAIKCFTRHVPGLRERYTEISAALIGAKLPFAVDFQYLVQGIRVRGDWFPILKMRWVEGQLLNELVRDNLDKPALLGQLGVIWGRMAKRLREAGIAHADLQHGNVILVPGSKAGSVAVKLIDYDGMFVPALASKKSGEVGHPNYQHPQRLREGIYNAEVDRFPLLVVATALRALSVGGRELWDRYDNSDNLLFRESDLSAPSKSPLFKELHNLADPQTRMLAEALQKAAEGKLEDVPLIDDLLPDAKTTKPVNPAPAAPKAAAEAPAESEQAAIVTAPPQSIDDGRTEPKRKPAGMPKWVWFAGGGAMAAGFLAVIGIGVVMMAFTAGDRKKGPDIAQKKTDGNPPKVIKNIVPTKETGDPTKEKEKEKEKERPLVTAPGDFIPLFNGKDLTGWKKTVFPGKWRVVDSILTGTEAPPLISASGSYRDFHLRLEGRVSDKSMAAVIFRGPESVPQYGYIAPINANAPALTKTGSLALFKPGNSSDIVSFQSALTKAGEWFEMDIIVQKNRILIKVNGQKTVDVEDLTNPEFTGGPIVLGTHPQSTVEFRKIEIKELNAVAKTSDKALRFKGKSHVELVNTKGIVDPNEVFTAEMWVRFSSGREQYLVGDESWTKSGAPVSRASGWVLRIIGGIPGPLNLTVADQKSDWWQVQGPKQPFGQDWTHLAVSKSTDTFRVFVNGELYASRECKGVKFVPCPSNLFLGVRKKAFGDRTFDGEIRAFRVSSKAIYDAEFVPDKTFAKTGDTRILLDFSVGQGKEIPDISGNNHHGTLVGAEWIDVTK